MSVWKVASGTWMLGVGVAVAIGAAVCCQRLMKGHHRLAVMQKLQWMKRWRNGKDISRISFEELSEYDAHYDEYKEQLQDLLRGQDREELIQLLLLASFYGFGNAFKEISEHIELAKSRRRRNFSFNNALFVAAGQGHANIVSYIMSTATDVDINAKNSHGNSALILACTNGHIDVVKLLVSAPTDLNIVNFLRETALTYACGRGFLEIVDVLMNRLDIDPSINDYQAVRNAVQRNHDRIVLTLLQRSRLAIVPYPRVTIEPRLMEFLQNAALETVHLCVGILNSKLFSEIPKHVGAFILTLAFGNSLVLIGPSRDHIWKISKLILDANTPILPSRQAIEY